MSLQEPELSSEVHILRRELAAREQTIAELEAKLEAASKRARLFEAVIESMGEGVNVLDPQGGNIINNAASQRMFGNADAEVDEDWANTYGFFHPDGSARLTMEEMPHTRALITGSLVHCEMLVRGPKLPPDFTIGVTVTPLRTSADGPVAGVVSVFRDVTEHKRLELALKQQNDALSESEREKADLVDKLRMAIDEVSTPILEVWEDVLALPIIGVVDSQRSASMMERLLDSVVQRRARVVVLDVTGVEVIDTATAAHFINMVRAVELLGARCVLCGIRPAVARTLVTLGLDLGRVRTFGTLRHALRASLTGAASEAKSATTTERSR